MRRRPTTARPPVQLSLVPEPNLSPKEKSALAEAMRDPAFWDEFEKLPEPEDAPGCVG